MYLGDFLLGDTFDFKFTTLSFATGTPTTLAGTPVISAYPNNSTTQLTAGITLTVDFDAVTGLNHVRVVATSGNGYATASNYDLVITAGTVNAVSVAGVVVGQFSIAARVAAIADAVWDEVLTGASHNIATSAGRRLRTITAVPMYEGTITDAAATTTSFTTSLIGYGDNFFNDSLLMVELTAGNWQSRADIDYVSATGTFIVDEPYTSIPANGVNIAVQVTHIHPISQVQAGLALETTAQIIKAKTNGLTFTVAGQVDANIQSVNDVSVCGNGQPVNEWNP